jgi:hypothetical protein
MTTYTTEDLEAYRKGMPKQGDHYKGLDSQEFIVEALFTMNEEPDPWISYTAQGANGYKYSCRLEAFLSRFTKVESE